MIQEKLLAHFKDHIKQSLRTLEERKNEISLALESENKSSAGDKHETGRAMIQLEREKLGEQIRKTEKNYEVLNQLKRYKGNGIIRSGSIVRTDNSNYYIAASIPPVSFESNLFYYISAESPIGVLLLTKKVGDTFTINGKTSRIKEVI